jgi:hypothetical protein
MTRQHVPAPTQSRPERIAVALCSHALRFGWLLFGLLSCNSLLGIGESSLRCDSDPCTTQTAGAGGTPAGSATPGGNETDPPDAGSGGGAGGTSSVDSTPTPATQGPPSVSASGNPESANAGQDAGAISEPSNGGSSGAGAGPVGNGGAPPDPISNGDAPAAACEDSPDGCAACLCGACRNDFAACAETPGCVEIVACARLTGCVGFECYCGSVDVITCGMTGRGDGPCLEQTLAAPGARAPTLANPSAGPASDAALAFGNCSAQTTLCADACQD